MKKQTDIAKTEYQKLYNTYELDKITEKEKSTIKKYNRSNLIYKKEEI